ncbi:hypothetical protein SKAU_G00171120 [Synaphobranchus kaupii]|uniref:Uncharacterized protein n=1 Tax=Synaphobranchus kaupii TaxID=118154 RepID=A0A9Q1J0V4_SYNKA|nr:hypothetical protein SKAU_G00171120 [Synaphobranchus kaupii]
MRQSLCFWTRVCRHKQRLLSVAYTESPWNLAVRGKAGRASVMATAGTCGKSHSETREKNPFQQGQE